jgi:hypothetical protein
VKTRAIAILGSSRSDGNTRRLLDIVLNDRPIEIIDLARLNIGYYDYHHRNAEDDFARLAPKLIEVRTIIFATPVYWYAMSAPLKTFIDRLSDLFEVGGEIGPALAGRIGYLVASSTQKGLPPGFDLPLQMTCDYLEMRWGGTFHGRFRKGGILRSDIEDAARKFGNRISKKGKLSSKGILSRQRQLPE